MVTSAELLRGVPTEELREAAMDCETIAETMEGAQYLAAKLAAAALELIAEGRESGAFVRAMGEAAKEIHGGPSDYCAEGYAADVVMLRALAGGAP